MPLVAIASRLVVLAVLLLSALFAPQLAPPQAPTGTSSVVISQVYAGGGSSTSSYKCDFIELFNRSADPVALAGLSLQWYLAEWTPIKFTSGSIPARAYFLVAPSSCSSSGAQPVPRPDYTGSIGLSTTKGQVALVKNDILITGVTDPDILDFVGYGTGSAAEGSPAPALTTTTSLQRADSGCVDGDNNSVDFSVLTPLARNTASATHVCSDPLAVRIAFFDARIDGLATRVTWETVDEIDALAFNLYDGPTVDGPWRPVNAAPIPAYAPGSTQGSRYDHTVQTSPGSPWLLLESIELSGLRESFGPVLVRPGEPNGVGLSRLSAHLAPPVALSAQVGLFALLILAPATIYVLRKRRPS